MNVVVLLNLTLSQTVKLTSTEPKAFATGVKVTSSDVLTTEMVIRLDAFKVYEISSSVSEVWASLMLTVMSSMKGVKSSFLMILPNVSKSGATVSTVSLLVSDVFVLEDIFVGSQQVTFHT